MRKRKKTTIVHKEETEFMKKNLISICYYIHQSQSSLLTNQYQLKSWHEINQRIHLYLLYRKKWCNNVNLVQFYQSLLKFI